jgi:uncharacterized protein (DUF2249 family)
MSQPTSDQAVIDAVVSHHAQLAAGLDQRVDALLEAAQEDPGRAGAVRDDLLGYLRREILPHAGAEEEALYPPARALAEGRALVDGMIAEHGSLAALVADLDRAESPVRAAASAAAVAALFAVHLRKENELVLPLLTAAGVPLAPILAGMHELLGGEHAHDEAGSCGCGGLGAGGCGCGGDRGGQTDNVGPAGHVEAAEPAAGGCACGGECGGGGAGQASGTLSLDTRLDVREVPHAQRHALVLSAVAALPPGAAVVLVAPHAPLPLLAQIDRRFGAGVQVQWLQDGPQAWQIRLERAA